MGLLHVGCQAPCRFSRNPRMAQEDEDLNQCVPDQHLRHRFRQSPIKLSVNHVDDLALDTQSTPKWLVSTGSSDFTAILASA